MDKLSEDISKSVLFNEFTKKTTFETYHVIEAYYYIIIFTIISKHNYTKTSVRL
jgi:hypothetical protein